MVGGKTFPVVEIFGPTLQGEGVLAGRPTHFVRFGGCDYRCAWCDSAHAVLPSKVREAPKMSETTIMRTLDGLRGAPEWVTLSGGNPALLDLGSLVERLQQGPDRYKVAIETQGTKWPDWMKRVDMLTLSPKGPSSTNETPIEELLVRFQDPSWWALVPSRLILKVVIFNSADYEYARLLHETLPAIPFYLSVGTMMGGLLGNFANGVVDSRDAILDRYRSLAEKVVRDPAFNDVVVLPQLHALLWGHERGH